MLAVVAAGIGRLCRRPALTHALWLLVLIKLITPPLVTLPMPWPEYGTRAAPEQHTRALQSDAPGGLEDWAAAELSRRADDPASPVATPGKPEDDPEAELAAPNGLAEMAPAPIEARRA